jgi:spore germination protein YaaH
MIIVMNGTMQYTIRPYDTIWMLAQVFNTTPESIMEVNPGINPTNLQVGQVITITPGNQYYPSTPSEFMEEGMLGNGLMDLENYFRMLWEQHVTWTSNVVEAIIFDLPTLELATQRLLRNPQDFANALMPFYGEEAAREFADLLTEHLTIAAELVKAAKAGDTNTYNDANTRWHQNANQIAALLGSLNPYWSEEDWSAMMEDHLNLLSTRTNNLLEQNYAQATAGYDDIELQALEMADMMAEGIYMQFPE